MSDIQSFVMLGDLEYRGTQLHVTLRHPRCQYMHEVDVEMESFGIVEREDYIERAVATDLSKNPQATLRSAKIIELYKQPAKTKEKKTPRTKSSQQSSSLIIS